MLIHRHYGVIPHYASSALGAVVLYRAVGNWLVRRYYPYHDRHQMDLCPSMQDWIDTTNFNYTIYENGINLCLVFSEPMEAKLFKLAFNL